MTNPTDLLDALAATPGLHGAACRGLAPTFDAPDTDEDPDDTNSRYNAALAVCAACPALGPCAAWFDALQPRERPLGVIAGRINDGRRGTAAA